MSLSMFLDRSATHERNVPTKDAIGGTVSAWATQTAGVTCALWPANSSLTRNFARRDIVGTHVIAVASNLGVKPQDRFDIGGDKYVVNGFELYSNSGVSSETLYLIDTTHRTV